MIAFVGILVTFRFAWRSVHGSGFIYHETRIRIEIRAEANSLSAGF
jgi:hypothetical protein